MKVKDLVINKYYISSKRGLCVYRKSEEYTDENNVTELYYVFEFNDRENLMITEEIVEQQIKNFENPGGKQLKLNKLRDSRKWMKTKADAEKKAREQASQLVKLYAERKNVKGFKFSKDGEEQEKFEKDCKFLPTDGQLRVVEEIKADMESDKSMNRLLNADTGFGKSEVCFRAAFKAVMDHKQVVLLLPSNLLAIQQFNDINERLINFPNIKVALLNGSVTVKNKKILLKDIKNGDIDIIVGTHGVLSDKVEFYDLGLVVCDEEQRFGVVQKEKLKKVKNNVDMLYMTATSTPRATYMAMSGIIDVSTIDTPPLNKKPIETKVVSSNDTDYIKTSIEFELKRDGQCYILLNNTNALEDKKEEIINLMKDTGLEVNIGIVNSKMKSKDMNKVMSDFKNKKYNILIATTVIEVGISIGNANTMIILDASILGLAQLHQLRNRISRNGIQGYCVLVYDKDRELNNIAIQRLKAMERYNQLGAGSILAKKDMEMRGAGNLVGTEQSGHMSKIGLDLYNEILENEIKKQKEELESKKDSDDNIITNNNNSELCLAM